MPRLIHLNGPPAIGKSTIAGMFAADHPGTLLLDIDRLRTLIGGWQEDFVQTGELVRPLAMTLADTHLKRGQDVVVPQFLGDVNEIEDFEGIAASAGAQFIELMLMADLEVSLQRFSDRGAGDGDELLGTVQSVVERSGGASYLIELHGQLGEVLSSRGHVIVIPSEPNDAKGTYRRVLAALDVPKGVIESRR